MMSEPDSPFPDNPYPLGAFAVFGSELGPTAEFASMLAVRAPLFAYLRGYPNQACRLALGGGHGSGKTHLLNWLGDQVRGVSSAHAVVLYAKPNSPDIAELYRLILGRLTRDRLLDVQRKALIAVGSRMAGAVKATAADARGLQDFESLNLAFRDKLLDPNEVQIELRQTLAQATGATDVSGRVAAALGLLDDTEYGEAAFAWLSGNASKTLPNEALAVEIFAGGGDMAPKMVSALATVAALFKIAGVPLIVLMDEMEKFLSPEDALRKSSNLKEILEQVGDQGAAILMAGTMAGWELMPRDVGPRLLQRDPMPIGALTLAECQDLLEVHVEARLGYTPAWPEPALAAIQDLSGGNAREILRIANRAFDKTGGDFSGFTEAVLTEAAEASGTLSDRRELARQILDRAAAELGMTVAPGAFPIDRLVQPPHGAPLPVAMAMVSDPTSEAAFGRALTQSLQDAGVSPGGALIIAIGYSSERVRKILTRIADVFVFDEALLKDQLRGALGRILATPEPSPRAAAAPDPALAEALKRVEEVLVSVERSRQAADRQVADLLSARAAAAAEPERIAAKVSTRAELRDGLDALSDALVGYAPEKERQTIRRLLIANETTVSNRDFDYLGTLYLEILDLERLGRSGRPGLHMERMEAMESLTQLRADVLRLLRRSLASPGAWGFSTAGGRTALASLAGLAGFAAPLIEFQLSGLALSTSVVVLSGAVAVLGGVLCLVLLETLSRPGYRYSSLRSRYDRALRRLDSD